MAAAAASIPPPVPSPAPNSPSPSSPSETFGQYTLLFDFLRSEGVLGLIGPARRGSGGGTPFVSGPPAPPILASALSLSVNLPTAQQALWRAKVRLARSRRRRVAEVVAYVEAAAAALLAAVLVGIAWRTVAASPPDAHRFMLVVVGVTTAIMVAIVAAVPLALRNEVSDRRRG